MNGTTRSRSAIRRAIRPRASALARRSVSMMRGTGSEGACSARWRNTLLWQSSVASSAAGSTTLSTNSWPSVGTEPEIPVALARQRVRARLDAVDARVPAVRRPPLSTCGGSVFSAIKPSMPTDPLHRCRRRARRRGIAPMIHAGRVPTTGRGRRRVGIGRRSRQQAKDSRRQAAPETSLSAA